MADPAVLLLEADHRRWIFPLRTPVIFAEAGSKALRDHINQKIFAPKQPECFLSGHLAYSRKDVHHLRRVLVLDPLATFFLYDFAYRNRKSFPRPPKSDRRVYGHCYHAGKPVDAFAEYHSFRRAKYQMIAEHGFFAQLDIFNCFNSFYHHEVTSFVRGRTTESAGEHFGQFLRELNAGVSVACFPQGFYPAKAIGNAYLSFVEQSRKLKAEGVARFLDDIVLAGASRQLVEESILELQYILDKHHLSLNDSKTLVGEKGQRFQERKLDKIKRGLLAKRESTKREYDSDDTGEGDERLDLKELEYLMALVRKPNVAQEDVELALTLLRHEDDAVELLVKPVLDNAPHLLRNFHRLIELVGNKDDHLRVDLRNRIRSERSFPEHDLFWYARILIHHLRFDEGVADMLTRIYEHPNASVVVKAAILETPHLDHGFADLKETAIRADGTLLTAAAAMVGLAKIEKSKRNHIFKYAAHQGPHTAVLMNIAKQFAV
jgi:hypothetical protein